MAKSKYTTKRAKGLREVKPEFLHVLASVPKGPKSAREMHIAIGSMVAAIPADGFQLKPGFERARRDVQRILDRLAPGMPEQVAACREIVAFLYSWVQQHAAPRPKAKRRQAR